MTTHWYTAKELREMLDACGFETLEIRGDGLFMKMLLEGDEKLVGFMKKHSVLFFEIERKLTLLVNPEKAPTLVFKAIKQKKDTHHLKVYMSATTLNYHEVLFLIKAEVMREIKAPLDKVWDFVTDLPRLYSEAATPPAEVELTSEQRRGAGATYSFDQDLTEMGAPGKRLELRGEITEWVEKERIAGRALSSRGSVIDWSYTLKPTETGTELRYVEEWKMPFLVRIFLRRAVEKLPEAAEALIENIKNKLEK